MHDSGLFAKPERERAELSVHTHTHEKDLHC